MSFRDLVERAWRENTLFTVLLELTYRCNLDCFFCYNDLSLVGKPMRLDDYLVLLDDLEKLEVLNLTLSGGEPLAHPDFFEIGSAARARGFLVRVKSNGHALRGEIARRLRDEVDPFIVEVSLHGACAETHDRQTRVEGSFDRLLENLAGLRDLGLRVKINSTLTLWNQLEVEGMYEIADSLGAPIQFDPSVTPRDDGDVEPLSVAPTTEGLEHLFKIQLARSSQTDGSMPDRERSSEDVHIPAADGKHCGAGSSGIAVDPFGNVYPCVAWRVAAGNLHETSIRDLWSASPMLDQVRQSTKDVTGSLAREGALGKLMNFCPGLSLRRTGSPDGVTEDMRERARTIQRVMNNESEG